MNVSDGGRSGGAPSAPDDPPVTETVTRRVKRGSEADFEALLAGVTAAAARFPGYLGTDVFRPDGMAEREYRVIFRFDHASNLRRWETSEERRHWRARSESLADGPPTTQVLTGLETWFTLPALPGIPPPPRYKMALVSWLAVFPLITVVFAVFGDQIARLPLVLRTLVLSGCMIATMTYIVMPRVTRLFARWLYPGSPDGQGRGGAT